MEESADFNLVHKTVLEIYAVFQKICEQHGLRYFAISGTTLGAVLWNGIIPWDDDMDITLPAEDYEKFIKLCKSGAFPEWIGLNEYIWFGAKIYDKRTTFTNVYYIDRPGRFSGISIDIVPLINVPNEKNNRLNFVEDLKKFHFAGMMYDRYEILYGVKTKKELFDWQKKFLNSYKFGETEYVMDFSDHRYILKAAGFEKPEIFKFENYEIPVSSNYNEDLTTQYGKYEKYPPKEKRASIHQQISLIDLKTPCAVYEKALIDSSEKIKKIIQLKHLYEGYSTEWIEERDKRIAELEEHKKVLEMTISQLENKLRAKRYQVTDKIVDSVYRLPIKLHKKIKGNL